MLRKPVFSYGAVALATAVLSLAAPRAAHAIAATLVQVTNTPANPAISQGTEKQAAQILELSCQSYQTASYVSCLQQTADGGVVYTPGTQSYVITAVDLLPVDANGVPCGSAASPILTASLAVNLATLYRWQVPAPPGAHFTYPSGIVIQPGGVIAVNLTGGGGCSVQAYLHGYLTAN
jgi:hypothetical protein